MIISRTIYSAPEHSEDMNYVETLTRNVGRVDRALRLGIGGLLLVLALSDWVTGLAATAILLFAWVPILTGLAGWCPFYTLLGISTRRR